MLKSYLKIAFRSALRYKGYSFINVAGLSLGMACSILVLLWVRDELSFDRFHTNADTLYRVEEDQHYSGKIFHVNVTPFPVAPAFKAEIPEVQDATRLSWNMVFVARYGDKVFLQDDILAVDPAFLQMFSFPLLKGDPAAALQEPRSIILTEEIAGKFFGDADPMGQVITLGEQNDFVVTGIMADVPGNSSIQFKMLVPFSFMREMGWYYDAWGSNSIVTYLQVPDAAAVPVVNQKMTELVHSHNEDSETDFVLQPLTDVHLHAYFGYGRPTGAIQYVYIFSLVALFVLLLACINFMNLSTARSANRTKEIGIRKVSGALRGHVAGQFMGESIFLAFISLVLALVVVASLLPVFNQLAGKTVHPDVLTQPGVLAGLVAVTLLTGIVSGSYPALFLSAFRPVSVLKGTLQSGVKSAALRKVLVVVQFSLSILLIIGTTVVYQQVQYMKSKDLGFDKEQLLYIGMVDEVRSSYGSLRARFLQHPEIMSVTAVRQPPPGIGSSSSGAEWPGKDPEQEVLISHLAVDYGYLETMKITLAEGRSFSPHFPSDALNDSTGNFLINESLAQIIGIKPAAGLDLSFWGRKGKIVGVMKDYHFGSVRREIGPLAIALDQPEDLRFILLRLRPGEVEAAIEALRTVWDQTVPGYPFEFGFVDQDIEGLYRAEERMGDVLRYFTILAVCISCLGLFGLAAFMSEQRTKEIGVRKVLGASVMSIVTLLSAEFVRWVVFATVLAWPIAYFAMSQWLQSFAFRIDLSATSFLAAAGVAVVIALLTVSSQAIKSALTDPAESLRYE